MLSSKFRLWWGACTPKVGTLVSALRVKFTDKTVVTGAGRAHSLLQGCQRLLASVGGDCEGPLRRRTPCHQLVQPRALAGTDFVYRSTCVRGLGTASISWSLCYFLEPLIIFPHKCECLQITSSRFYLLAYDRLYAYIIIP